MPKNFARHVDDTVHGVLWLHHVPAPIAPHISWALARLGVPEGPRGQQHMWRQRPQVLDTSGIGPGGPAPAEEPHAGKGSVSLCAELELNCSAAAMADFVTFLERWPGLYFELAHDAIVDGDNRRLLCDGMRYCHTPHLGTFAASTDAAGNIVITEDRMRYLITHSSDIATDLDVELAGPWDRALEPMRVITAAADPEDLAALAQLAHDTAMKSVGTSHPAELDRVEGSGAQVVELYPRRAAM